jgi:hypothetical protein
MGEKTLSMRHFAASFLVPSIDKLFLIMTNIVVLGPLVVLPEISYFRDSTIQNSLIRESLITRSLAMIHNITCVTAQYYILTTTLQFKEDRG